ncbi:MAG TPA: hypothetical protein VG276_28755 [Actinomycetes bacterium]|nr:hypothetical protein [Actinomycetes bacterium]
MILNFACAVLMVCGVLYLVGWPHRRRTYKAACRAAVDAAWLRAQLESAPDPAGGGEVAPVTQLPTGRGDRGRRHLN